MSLNPMSFNMGGIGSWVARQIARPTPPEAVAKWMNRVSHPSAENILPTMALESGVISGRSIYAWTRSGLLETQERFFEEASVAALWFWGVGWMEKAFDKALQWVGPKSLKALDPGIGWAVKDGSLRLNPLESHMPNAQAAEKLLYLKSARLFFSVASSIALVALAVPWINQKKTEWIIDKYFKKNHEPSPSFSGTLPLPNLSIQRPSGFSPFLPPQLRGNTPGSRNHPQFSGLPGINQLGHWVQDTDLGKLFAIDTGIFAGRTYTAAKRSRFESIEIGLRDLSSYYFYFLAVPHCFKVLNFIAEKTLKGNILLEPQVAETLLKRIQEKSKEWKTSLQFGKSELDKFLYGELPESLGSPEALSQLKNTLMRELRTAHPSKFIHHLKPALEALHPNPAKQTALLEAILDALNSSDTPLGRGIQGDALQGLLEKIESGGALPNGEASNAITPLGQLSTYEKKDLTVALKQAFHHSTGLTREECLQLPGMKTLKQTLPQKEWEALEKRLSVLVERDTTEQALNLFQRIRLLVTPILEKSPESQPLFNALETLGKQLNQAQRRAIPMEKNTPQEMSNLLGA
ncbi:MAG: hypothetical protein K2X66_03730, partial [Cyanobacteria bacterium]|nr:hypothetical protein [Cyanobacteriota bacterium]